MEDSSAVARLFAALSATKERAQALRALLARCIVQHGLPFVQKLCRQLAHLLQRWQHAATLRLRTVAPWQKVGSARLAADRLTRRAVASTVLVLNSTALKLAAKQLMTISLSNSQAGTSGTAYTCHVRLFGGLLW